MMTPQQKEALLEAIRRGKGFVGVHSTIDNFGRLLGAEYLGHGPEQNGQLILIDKAFPGNLEG